MRFTVVLTLVALMSRFGAVASAQEAASRQQASASPNLPAQSFDELRSRLRLGDELLIRDVDGRTTRGRLSELTNSSIEVEWHRWFRFRNRTLTEPAVRQIRIRDSARNGILIGLAVGGAVAGLGCKADKEGYVCPFLRIFAPVVGGELGETVDLLINRSVYEAPGHATAAFWPVLGPGRIGLGARVGF
jgi:hypothetical protein